jgi:hypothetical protein
MPASVSVGITLKWQGNRQKPPTLLQPIATIFYKYANKFK